MTEYFKRCLAVWDWRLYAFILLFLGLPSVYNLYRVRLVGTEIPDAGGLAIVSQWQFVGLAVEVFQEASVLAIFFFLGTQIRRDAAIQIDRAKSVLTFIFLASLLFSVGLFVFRSQFIALIGTAPDIEEQTRAYLGISIFSIPFTLLAAAIVVLFEALGLRRQVFLMAAANILLRFGFDSLFFGGYGFSLDAGILGVGWATLWASVGLLLLGLALFIQAKDLRLRAFQSLPSFADLREYLRVGLGSGADSLVRNIAYFFMIIRLVNTIGATEIGGYYVAIQILWSFMLVPVLALSDTVKALVANAAGDWPRIRLLWHAAMLITAALMLVWLAAVPAFPAFAGVFTDDPETRQWAVTAFGILFVPYVMFSFNTVMDGVFYGTGQTKYLAYQSVLTNGTVYLAAFLLYWTGAWAPSFQDVMALFALGILADSILTMAFLLKALYFGQPDSSCGGAASRNAANP